MVAAVCAALAPAVFFRLSVSPAAPSYKRKLLAFTGFINQGIFIRLLQSLVLPDTATHTRRELPRKVADL